MKKLFTLLALMLSLGYAAHAQSADLAIINSFKSIDTVKWDSKGTHGRIIYYAFINHGPTSLLATDSLYWKNPILGNVRLTLPSGGFPANDTLYFTDTLFQNKAVTPNPYTWCDSIWAKRSGTIIPDPVMTNNYNCKSVRFIQTSPVGVENIEAQEGALTVYPNPASNSLSFSFDFRGNGSASVSVVDLLGKAVLQKDLGKVSSGNHTYSVDVSNPQSGVYILELVQNGTKAVSRIVIQK
jgi:hypothetical protein